jgi:hypothetical protein
MNSSGSRYNSSRKKKFPTPVHINIVQLPQADVKYLGLHLDRILTRHKYTFTKWKQMGSLSPKCIGYLNTSQNSPQVTAVSYIKEYSNQSGLKEYNIGVWLPPST